MEYSFIENLRARLRPSTSALLLSLSFVHCLHAERLTTGSPGADLDSVLGSDLGAQLAQFESYAQESLDAGHAKEIIIYPCKYIKAVTLRRVLEEFITSEGMVAESGESDQVIVSDVASNLGLLRQIIGELDKPVPQILVESRIVELNIDSDFEKELSIVAEELNDNGDIVERIGTILTTPGASPTDGVGALFDFEAWSDDNDSLNVVLRYLETRGRAKILSAPNLVIQRGKEGSIVTGEEVPILSQTSSSGGVTTSTEFKSVGIKLSVKPTMIAGDRVRLEIHPEVSTVIGFSEAGNVSNPIIAVRQARTELEVMDGQLVSMAGLLQSTERNTQRRVPILGAIPLMGPLFNSNRKETVQTQLVIFLSIRILDAGVPDDVRIIRPSNLKKPILDEIERMEEENSIFIPDPTIQNDFKMFNQ